MFGHILDAEEEFARQLEIDAIEEETRARFRQLEIERRDRIRNRRVKIRTVLLHNGYARTDATHQSEDQAYAETWKHEHDGDVVILGLSYG